jgi:hypothetical protein
MKVLSYISTLVLVLLVSCQNIEKVEKPKKLLSKAEMKDLVYDMILLDATVGVDRYKLQDLDIEMLEFLSKKYGIDSIDLKQNVYYYNVRHDDNLEIYESVKDSIIKLENAYDSISKAIVAQERQELRRLDSIKSIDTIKEIDPLKTKDSISKQESKAPTSID